MTNASWRITMPACWYRYAHDSALPKLNTSASEYPKNNDKFSDDSSASP
jgi:hypothetical protein